MAVAESVAKTNLKKRSGLTQLFTRLVKEKPLGFVGAIIVLILFFTGIFANLSWIGLPNIGLAPYGMNELHAADSLEGPSLTYLLGTDNLGRDILSRIIYGARVSMIVGVVAASIAITLSTTIGLTTGYIGGKLDLIAQRFIDAWLCFPAIVIMIIVMSIAGAGMINVIIVMGISYGISMSRVVRGAVLSIKQNIYVDAANSIGCSTPKILLRHILPNIAAPIIVLFTTCMPTVILQESSLSFLGFGIPPPTPSWGGMLSGSGRAFMYLNPWMAVWPGVALASVVYGINMFGDALRDLLDPRLRGGLGRYGVKLPKTIAKKVVVS